MIDSARLFRASAPLQAPSAARSSSDPSPESRTDLIDVLAVLPAESGTPIVSTLDADGNPLATDPPASDPLATDPLATDPQPTLPGEDASLVRELVDFERRQRQLVLATVVISAFALPISALVWDLPTAGSVLVGALAGLLYLRLLARSVQRLGTASKQMGRAQLLVPVVLVLMAAKVPQLQLLPALLGFLLYKPALFLQARPDA